MSISSSVAVGDQTTELCSALQLYKHIGLSTACRIGPIRLKIAVNIGLQPEHCTLSCDNDIRRTHA